jgi:hypothetical protein
MTKTKSSKQPKYRRPLNSKQLLILKLLYKFRYLTVDLLMTAQGHKYQATHSDRLKVLLEQEYIGRHYDNSYRIDRRYGEYYILPKGINILKNLDIFKPNVLKRLYRDKTASQHFINHSLNIFKLYNTLRRLYPDTFSIYTAIELSGQEDLPEMLPDALFKPSSPEEAKEYYLECVEDLAQVLKVKRKITSYLKHCASDEWQDTDRDYPSVLILTELDSTQKTLHKFIAKKLSYSEAVVNFYTTTLKQFHASIDNNAKIWHEVGEDELIKLDISPK